MIKYRKRKAINTQCHQPRRIIVIIVSAFLTVSVITLPVVALVGVPEWVSQ